MSGRIFALLRYLSFSFCLIYPFLIVSVSSSLAEASFVTINQAARHLLVWAMAIATVIENRAALRVPVINKSVKVAATASGLAALIWLSKSALGGNVSFSILYSAVEPIVVILCAAGLSWAIVRRSQGFVFFLSLVFWLALFVIIHAANGLELHTAIYGRTRWTFGFNHPGKLAQLIMVAVLFAIFAVNLEKAKVNKFLLYLVVLSGGVIIYLTNTRAMFLVFAIAVLWMFVSRVKASQSIGLVWVWIFAAVAGAMYVFIFLDELSRSFLLSGRIGWWILSLDLNFGHDGSGTVLWGTFDDPIGNRSYIFDDVGSDVNSFRADSGYLEVFITHGIFVTLLLVSALMIFLKSSTARDLRAAALVIILMVFLFGEAGFFAVGNFFGLLVVSLVMVSNRTPIEQLNSLRRGRRRRLRFGRVVI